MEMPQEGMSEMAPEGMEAPGGYEICIKVDAQGGISVGREDAREESAEPAMSGEEGEYTPAGSIKEALQIALTIFKGSGKAPSAAEDEQAGFNEAIEQQ